MANSSKNVPQRDIVGVEKRREITLRIGNESIVELNVWLIPRT